MSTIDETVKANEEYAREFSPNLTERHRRKLAVVTCMDARIDVFRILGLQPGEAYVIRNAGGIADDSAVRSLLVAQRLLGVGEFMLIHHTDCGMLKFSEREFAARLRQESGTSAVSPSRFYAFDNIEDDLREQIEKLRSHPWIPKDVPVRGFIYDLNSGRLREYSA